MFSSLISNPAKNSSTSVGCALNGRPLSLTTAEASGVDMLCILLECEEVADMVLLDRCSIVVLKMPTTSAALS